MAIFDFIGKSKRYTQDELNAAIRSSITETLNIYRLQGGEISPYSTKVSNDNVLGLSAVWSCVKLISETFAGLPYHVYKRNDNGVERTKHPIESLLTTMPVGGDNPMTSFNWFSLAMAKVLLKGNFYAWIMRDNLFRPIALIPILDDVKLRVVDGELYYNFNYDGADRSIPSYDMFHIKGYSEDGYIGKSVIAAHRDTLGISLSAQKASKDFYEKGAKLDGYLSTDQTLKPDTLKGLKDSWNDRNQERVPLLDAGIKYLPIKLSPQDAQYIETRKFGELEIARIFRVPPHMIGIMDRATWSNVEALGIEFAKYTMLPYCINWEQEINNKLFMESEKDMLFGKFSLEGLMRADMKTRYESHKLAIQNGIMSINEVRALENLNPVESGDKHYIQGNNMVDIKDIQDLADKQV